MTYEEIKQAIEQAREVTRQADIIAARIVENQAAGRLRSLPVGVFALVKLKRELKRFDAAKLRWK